MYNKIGRKNRRNGILYTTLIPYTIYMIIILVVFFVLIELLIYNHTKSTIEKSTDRTLQQIYQISDILLEYNFSYYYDVYHEEQARRYMTASEMEVNEYTAVIDYLLSHSGRDLITQSIYLYNEKMGMIFSSKDGAFPVEDFYDQEIIRFLKQSDKKERFLLRKLEGLPGSAPENENVISYCFQDETAPSGNGMALVINIDQEKYQKLLGENLKEASVMTEVISSEGLLISGNDRMIGEKITDVYAEDILKSNKEKDSFDCKAEDGKYYISWQNSSYFGWIYIGKANYDDLLSEFYIYNRVIIAAAVFLVLLGFFSSSILTQKIYGPLRQLMNHVNIKGIDKEKYQDEYEILKNVLSGYEASANEMQTMQHRYKINKRDEVIQRLLRGDSSWNRVENDLHETGVILNGNVYCVAGFSFNHLNSLKSVYSWEDMKIFCFTMVNILEEYLNEQGCMVYGVEDEDYSVNLIMQLDKEYEDSDEYRSGMFPSSNITDIQKLLFGAKQELEKALKPVTFFVSVGRSVTNYEGLHRSWLDTKFANIYRFTRGTQLVTLFTPHMESYESGIQYPWNIEKKLLAHMKAADKDVILTTLEDFFDAIKKMAPDEMRWAVNQITSSVFRDCMAHNYKMKDGSPLDWKNWTNKINETDTSDEMREVLTQLLMNLSIGQEDSFLEKQKIAGDIKAYVDDHFCESMLSVSEIASSTGFSVNYARQIFKDKYGFSISDYIVERRIEKAKELLTTTNYTSKKIAELVGYTDNRYFYVVFKKNVGETTESYRRKKGFSSEGTLEK